MRRFGYLSEAAQILQSFFFRFRIFFYDRKGHFDRIYLISFEHFKTNLVNFLSVTEKVTSCVVATPLHSCTIV